MKVKARARELLVLSLFPPFFHTEPVWLSISTALPKMWPLLPPGLASPYSCKPLHPAIPSAVLSHYHSYIVVTHSLI